MTVDSFKYLPRLIGAIYESTRLPAEEPIPWTPVRAPLSECKFGLVTTAGLYQPGVEAPFDMAREVEEPTWGDPTFRTIPRDISQEEIGISHLHVNNRPVLEDFNIVLPLDRFRELEQDGRIGGLAGVNYSFMGFQGYPPDTTAWRDRYGPQVARAFLSEGVHCLLLTPS